MDENAGRVSRYPHLPRNFFIGALLNTHQPKRFRLLVRQPGQFGSDNFNKLFKGCVGFRRKTSAWDVVYVSTDDGPAVAAPQTVNRPPGRQPTQKGTPVRHGTTSTPLDGLGEHLLTAIKRIFLVLYNARHRIPHHRSVDAADTFPVGQWISSLVPIRLAIDSWRPLQRI